MSLIDNIQQVLDALNLGVLLEDAERSIVYTNKMFLDIFDMPGDPSILVGVNCTDAAQQAKEFFTDPEQFLVDTVEIPLKQEPNEGTVETKNGKFFKRKYTCIKEGEEVRYHLWTYEDVTELVVHQKRLEDQRAFFQKILNEIPADIAIFTPEHKYLFVNKTGIKNEEIRTWIIGKDDYEYVAYRGVPTAIADERRKRFDLVKESGNIQSWVDELTKPDGTKDYVLRIFYPYMNKENELELMIGYGVNISDQKKKELELAHEKEKYSSLVSSLKDGVFQCKLDGSIIMGNDAVLNIIDKITPEKGEGQRNIFDIVQPEDLEKLLERANLLKQTGTPQRGVVKLKPDVDGHVRYVDTYVWLSQDEVHNVIFTGRISDITEQVLKKIQMEEMIAREKELNSLKNNFIHITSHELRTPLSVILSSAEILEMAAAMDKNDLPEDIDAAQFTDSIVKEVNRITEILDEMLMVGRIEKGTLKFKPEKTDMQHYLETLSHELYQPYHDGRNLNIHIDTKDLAANIDMRLMRHAVCNLVNNAFKYSAGKEVPTVRLYRRDGHMCIEVKDKGIGVPQEEMDMLFNSFFRASNVGNISGNGIGLMVVDHVVKMHNGTVEVNNNEGEGITFTIVVPE
ncbi:MAG: ATP-binding protein [Flavipsychrobacter sp.]